MPQRPPCTGIGTTETIIVSVYMTELLDGSKHSKIYLRRDCLDWLLSYAADELHFQGVTCETPERECTKKASCPDFPDLNLEWDFDAKAWDAEFVSGPLVGTTKHLTVADIKMEQC